MKRPHSNNDFEVVVNDTTYSVDFDYSDELTVYPDSYDGMTPGTAEVTKKELTINKLYWFDEDDDRILVKINQCRHEQQILKAVEDECLRQIEW